jgi:glutamate-1-semialdehyde 2,1-aminomutase
VSRCGPILTVFFGIDAPHDAREALLADRAAFARFFGALLDAGILLPPSQFEAWFPSLAHSPADFDAIASAAADALRA